MVIYLVVPPGIGCGFGARAVMLGKGRSGSAGFCLGFSLGLVGLIAALLSSTPEHEARRMQQQMQLMGIGGFRQHPAESHAFASASAMTPAGAAKSHSHVPVAVLSLVCVVGYVALIEWKAYRYIGRGLGSPAPDRNGDLRCCRVDAQLGADRCRRRNGARNRRSRFVEHRPEL